MTRDVRKGCPFCAWRATCAKKFSMSEGMSMHCADFSEDIQLKGQLAKERLKEGTAEDSE